MLLPVLAGLGALSLMSNPRRRRRTTRRNPEFQFAVEHAKTGRQRVSPWFPSREEGERWLARLNRDDGAGTWRRLGRATRRGRMGGGRLDREIHGESLNLRAAASYGNRAEMDEAQSRLDRLSKARRMMARRTNPGPTAKDIRLLVLLQNELAVAEGRYEGRTHRSDARKLRREAVEARLRYRRFFRAMEAKTRSNPATPEGTDSRGTRYKLRKNTETAEWMLVAYVNGKRHEGRTLYFPFDRYDRASVAEARKDAENTLAHVTGARSNPRRRGRRNPGTISRTSLTDAEAAIGGKALLGSKRSGAWAMSHASAKTFANRLRHGFKVVPSSHAGHDGKQLYLVTDGHWYVG